jgi:hypothetical protein
MVPEERLELSRLAAVGFESTVYTIPPLRLGIHLSILHVVFHLAYGCMINCVHYARADEIRFHILGGA